MIFTSSFQSVLIVNTCISTQELNAEYQAGKYVFLTLYSYIYSMLTSSGGPVGICELTGMLSLQTRYNTFTHRFQICQISRCKGPSHLPVDHWGKYKIHRKDLMAKNQSRVYKQYTVFCMRYLAYVIQSEYLCTRNEWPSALFYSAVLNTTLRHVKGP